MSIPGKVLIALLSALLVAAAVSFIDPEAQLLNVFVPASVAALLAVLLSHRALPMPGAIAAGSPAAVASDQAAPSRPAEKSRGRNADQKSGAGKSRKNDKRPPRNDRSGEDRKGDSQGRGGRRSKAPAADGGEKTLPRDVPSPAAASNAPAETGTVKWFNASKGYGFIIRENGDEIFVHHRSVQGDGRGRLDDGASVRFRVVTTDKGPQAEDVESV